MTQAAAPELAQTAKQLAACAASALRRMCWRAMQQVQAIARLLLFVYLYTSVKAVCTHAAARRPT